MRNTRGFLSLRSVIKLKLEFTVVDMLSFKSLRGDVGTVQLAFGEQAV